MTLQIDFEAMGCHMLGIVDAEDEALPALESLPAQFEAWEQSLSRFRAESELCELNRHPATLVAVSRPLWEVFEASCQAELATRGLVNPLVADAVIHAGYDRNFDQLLPDSQFPTSLEMTRVPALADVLSDAAARTLQLPLGARLDFGGVAKGWAAAQVVNSLSRYGSALFSAGGDIAVSGLRSGGEPWRIGVDDPFRPGEYADYLYLERGGVATSGKDYRHWMRNGTMQHHIIDPRTGLPAETDILTATVIAPDAVLAEAFAKAILISGSDAGLAWLESDDRLAGLLILDNGQRLQSSNISAFLER